MIKDSGNRTEFATGAVRDIQEGKGRCDLLPLDVVAELLASPGSGYSVAVIDGIRKFMSLGYSIFLKEALRSFVIENKWDYPTMLLELSKHFEEGAKKYGEYNWQKGIPISRYIDSAIRHYLKWLRGDTDEAHDRAFCWNIVCAIWTCKHKPDLNDYAKAGESGD